MLCNFLTNNILGREGLLCPNGIKVKRFKHLMLLRLPSGHSRHAASSCSSSRWQSTYTAVITKLHLSNSVTSWRYWRVYIKQENMERSMKLEDGLLSETVILSRDLSLLLEAIQTSAPHINNFPFLLHSLLAASVSLLFSLSGSRPCSCQANRTFSDTPLWGHSSFGLEFKCQGEEEWWGSDKGVRGSRLRLRALTPRHASLSSHPSQTFETLA